MEMMSEAAVMLSRLLNPVGQSVPYPLVIRITQQRGQSVSTKPAHHQIGEGHEHRVYLVSLGSPATTRRPKGEVESRERSVSHGRGTIDGSDGPGTG